MEEEEGEPEDGTLGEGEWQMSPVLVLVSQSSQVKVCSSWRQESHMQRQWDRLARRGWCAGVVPTAPRSLEGIRREMRQAKPPARGGAARASLGVYVVFGCSPLLSPGGGPGSGGG